MEAMIEYFQAHPLIGLGLALLVGMILGSLLKRLLKLAFWLGLIFLAGLYLTHREAEAEWQVKADELRRQGEELLKMAGETGPASAWTVRARATTALRKRPGRYEFQRGVLEQSGPGEFTVRSAGAQGSGILRSMSEANCFIMLEPDQTAVDVGDEVVVQPFQNLI